ncbi:MAG: HAMP domain-containing protein [Candidatus Latescibacteria bacterium]|nr:HAMP domain-containing protein [Candidatus Latescibacterota bacterium]
MRTSLSIKVVGLIILTLIAGFGALVTLSVRRQTDTLMQQAEERANSLVSSFTATLRNAMLAGDGPLLANLLDDVRRSQKWASLRIYDKDGQEIYKPSDPNMRLMSGDQRVVRVLNDQTAQTRYVETEGTTRRVTQIQPLPNERACRVCHTQGEDFRGAVMLTTERPNAPASVSWQAVQDSTTAAVARVIRETITYQMLAQGGDSLTTYLTRLTTIQGLSGAVLFDPTLQKRYTVGRVPDAGAVTAQAGQAARTGEPGMVVTETDSTRTVTSLSSFPHDEKCSRCHTDAGPSRGVLALATSVSKSGDPAARIEALQPALLSQGIGLGIKTLMLTGKGVFGFRLVEQYRDIEGVAALHVFNPSAEEVFAGEKSTSPTAPSPPAVQDAFRTGLDATIIDTTHNQLVQFTVISNEEKCQGCHGADHIYRAVVETTISLDETQQAIQRNRRLSLITALITTLAACGVLILFTRLTVVKPVQVIGNVAEQVGQGDLTVHVAIQSRDEIGHLARRINEMIAGLRAKLQMEKFVPRSAVDLIAQAAEQQAAPMLGGTRRTITVLFSDIRGFTSYSEKVSPEEVIELVNRYLTVQAMAIAQYHGEVDKYVGDEVMAVFEGEDMALNAVRCALAIRSATGRLSEETDSPHCQVGIGINVGEAVVGNVGSPDRLNYTALGDTVNTGKRLCDVAKPGEVLITAAAYEQVRHAIQAQPLEPLKVKGKEHPLEVYRVKGG